MKRIARAPIGQVELKFKKKAVKKAPDILTEISTSVVVGNNLFVAYDESSAIERLTWKDGKYKKHKTFELDDFFPLPGGREGEMDIEGLAWERPYLWFSGSMSLKRNTPDPDDDPAEAAEKLLEITTDDNRFSIGRIPCVHDEETDTWTPVEELELDGVTHRALMMEGGAQSTALTEALATDDHLEPFMKIPCKDNGFDIEGLAVHGERIFLGMRGPVLGGWAIIIEFSVHESQGWLRLDVRGDKDKPYRKHFIHLAGMGIREINFDPDNGDMLLLAGPTMDLDGTIAAWKIADGLPEEEVSVTHHAERLFDVVEGHGVAHGHNKAEGMAITGRGNYLIVYDSPDDDYLVGKRSVLADVYAGENARW